jgi:hypothetical protein
MSVLVSASPYPFNPLFLPSRDEGVSVEAAGLRREIGESYLGENTCATGGVAAAEGLLLRALEGAEASAVSSGTLQSALAFLWSLPSEYPHPDVVVEDDGQLGFDWDFGPDRVLSVNVGDSGVMGYAALIGAESMHGRAPFAGTIPEAVARLLFRLFNE